MTLLGRRWCAIYCCSPCALLVYGFFMGLVIFFCAILPAPFVVIYALIAGPLMYIVKLFQLKNIWVTREDLLK